MKRGRKLGDRKKILYTRVKPINFSWLNSASKKQGVSRAEMIDRLIDLSRSMLANRIAA